MFCVLVEEIECLLEFLDEFPQILLVHEYGLPDELAGATFRSFALDNIQEKIAVDILLHIEKIGPVFSDQFG